MEAPRKLVRRQNTVRATAVVSARITDNIYTYLLLRCDGDSVFLRKDTSHFKITRRHNTHCYNLKIYRHEMPKTNVSKLRWMTYLFSRIFIPSRKQRHAHIKSLQYGVHLHYIEIHFLPQGEQTSCPLEMFRKSIEIQCENYKKYNIYQNSQILRLIKIVHMYTIRLQMVIQDCSRSIKS